MEEEILRVIEERKEETVKFLQKLISFDSQIIEQGKGGKEGKTQRFLAKEFKKLGAEVDIFEPDNKRLRKYPDFNPGHDYKKRPNVVAVFKGEGGGRSIILNGHIDTVSPGNLALWKYNPYIGEIVGRKIFGLGAVDMKSGVSAMIMAIKVLKNIGAKLKGDIIFQSVVDEEGGGNGTLDCVDRGYKADVAIIAEPTNLEICAAHRGVMHLRIKVKGLSTHACLKEKGVNAIEKMVKIMKSLEELEKRWLKKKRHSLLPSPTITFCQISGGVGASIIPEECEAKVNIKYLPAEKKKDVQKEVEEKIRTISNSDVWLKKHPPELTWLLNTSPYETKTSHPLVKILKESAIRVTGKAKVSGLPSGADARILNNVGHVPTFIFGPGDLSQAHHVNESLPIREYINSIKIFSLVILDWVGKISEIPT